MQAPLVNPMSSTVLPRLVVSVGAVVGLHLARQRRAQQVSRAPTSAGARRASVDTARPAAAVAAAAAASLPLWQSSAAPLTALLTLWSPANLLRAVSAAAASASVCWSRVAVGAVATWSAVSTQLVEAAAQFADARKALPAETCIDEASVRQFAGAWSKVASRSEPMDSFCELFGVPRWLRQATRLMSGLEVALVGNELVVRQVCRLSWLSTLERFPLDGSPSAPHKRRDMRAGKQIGTLLAARDGRMTLQVAFMGALPGQATDTLLLRGDELRVLHEARIEGRGQAHFSEVYRRS